MNNKSDRIIVIDAIKGFAALMIVVVHGVVFGIFDPDPAYYSQLLERLTVGLIIVISPIMLMATWFTIFVFIAGMTITLAYLREMERGERREALTEDMSMKFTIGIQGGDYL